MTTGAKQRKSQRTQTKQVSNQTTSENNLLQENLKHLRNVLSVDTIIDDINQEEALEFLDAVEANICTEREDHADALNEAKEQEFTVDELIKKLKDKEVDSDQSNDLIEIIAEDNSEKIYDYVQGKGYVYVKIDTMFNEEKLRNFIEREIYPRYADQVENIMF